MPDGNVRAFRNFSKRPAWDTHAFRRMCRARQQFAMAMQDWLRETDQREGQIEVDGSLRQIQQIAAIAWENRRT